MSILNPKLNLAASIHRRDFPHHGLLPDQILSRHRTEGLGTHEEALMLTKASNPDILPQNLIQKLCKIF